LKPRSGGIFTSPRRAVTRRAAVAVPVACPMASSWGGPTALLPACLTRRGRSGRPSESFTLKQAKALLAAAESTRWHACVALSLLAGIRTEEARALRWDHVVSWVDDSVGWQPVRCRRACQAERGRRRGGRSHRAGLLHLRPMRPSGWPSWLLRTLLSAQHIRSTGRRHVAVESSQIWLRASQSWPFAPVGVLSA
jgi:hypothetical protein